MKHVLLIGAGPLGAKVGQFIVGRTNLALAGVVDLNPDLRGKTAGELIEGAPGELKVTPSLDEAISRAGVKVDAVVLATVSSIRKILPSIREIAARNLDIVTTCEELSYPWRQHPEEAKEIEHVCKSHGITCLGTGVNPGFLMDYLPSVITAIHQRVDSVLVERVQDASIRRIPFQKKIGAGLTPQEFAEAKENGTLRHVGLPESLDMIAAAMNWNLDETSETLEPALAETDITSGYKPIRKGEPAGVEQVATGILAGREVIRLRFRAAVGEETSYDRIVVTGDPGAEILIRGGVNGDVATAAITTNAIRSAIRAKPGLQTMLDVPVPAWFGGKVAQTSKV